MILGRDTAHLRLPLLKGYLENVEQRYEKLKQGESPHHDWQSRLVGIGQPVTIVVMGQDEPYEGVIAGVDEAGALRLQQKDGSIITILAGDVTLKK
jgi:biotin-(acetyl-CoA carboxylase) ligase